MHHYTPQPLFQCSLSPSPSVKTIALNCCNVINATQGNERNAGNKQRNKCHKSTKQLLYDGAYPSSKTSLFDSENLGFYLATMGTFVHCAVGICRRHLNCILHNPRPGKLATIFNASQRSVQFQVQICSCPRILSCFKLKSHYVCHLLAIHVWSICLM